jgi:ABC-type Na+ efflux pump permease subunit
MAPVAVLIVSAAVSAAGAVQQGNAAKSEAESQKNMADYNAQLAEREAQSIEQKTAFDQSREAEAGSERMSSLKAALGASGAVTSAGSPLLIMAKQASENELTNLGIGQEGQLAASRARSEGALQTMQGKIYQQGGQNAQTASYFKAGSTALDAFGKYKGYGK